MAIEEYSIYPLALEVGEYEKKLGAMGIGKNNTKVRCNRYMLYLLNDKEVSSKELEILIGLFTNSIVKFDEIGSNSNWMNNLFKKITEKIRENWLVDITIAQTGHDTFKINTKESHKCYLNTEENKLYISIPIESHFGLGSKAEKYKEIDFSTLGLTYENFLINPEENRVIYES